ncbi:hypothetical protein C4K05_1582 [Pseudomonas chlororaphis subsp. aureofaciens]|uniref:Uncharacterized protein n=1 Tax=Pseudomonas chlororaphis subsp. aureofaciens TaxID=587851 RepID=A0AAD0ZCF0_9PSED|nr:hypothetical protein C4K07_1557 [Pseudomonas chlororaphis subsp. aureofaciens]AZE40937.1 hypothetical protein C4K05_1582 [Pseudomonas chlororaphis subsp. aureofaciens]
MRPVSGALGSEVVEVKSPDLYADLVPGISGAGFRLGESLEVVEERIGPVEWFENDCDLQEVLAKSHGWVGVVSNIGQAIGLGIKEISFSYMDDVVSLFFEEKKILYRILVGKGYLGGGLGVRPGDSVLELSSLYKVEFNCEDDEFFVVGGGGVVEGVSFITDYRASLEYVPEQVIQYISIHDWELR